MIEPSQSLPHVDFSDSVESKAARRRQDAEDVAAGRRTAAEVQRENAWFVPDPAETIILNEYAACAAL